MVIGIFTHFFALETTLAERQFFRALAKLIGRRAARLSACGIAAIVSKMNYLDEGCSVGADGSLYNVKALLSVLPQDVHAYAEIPWVCRSRARRFAGHFRRQGTVSGYRLICLFPSDLSAWNHSNIVTYHAEDGSGVGSAIIAGSYLRRLSCSVSLCSCYFSHDEAQEGCRVVP